jgi:hypothetical protein
VSREQCHALRKLGSVEKIAIIFIAIKLYLTTCHAKSFSHISGYFKENKQLFSNVLRFIPRNITLSLIFHVIISDALFVCREFE